MDYFLPSSVKSRLLRFALAKTGFLDTDALDLDKLNFSIGRKSNAEFRDVGLRLEKLTALLQLPPTIRLLAARAVLVRVSISSDLTITAEVDGIQVHAAMEDAEVQKEDQRHPESLKTPRHRKTARRISTSSNHDHDPGGLRTYDEKEAHLPTPQDLASSFLDVEPVAEKQELEAALLSQSRNIDESVFSDTSDESGMGTGNALGLPVFLAAFLQGVVDRLTVKIRNVTLRCDATIPPINPADRAVPVGIMLTIGTINVDAVASSGSADNKTSPARDPHQGRRRILLDDARLDMLCEASKSPEPSPVSPSVSPVRPRTESPSSVKLSSQGHVFLAQSIASSHASLQSVKPGESAESLDAVSTTSTFQPSLPYNLSPTVSTASTVNSSKGRFADADEDDAGDAAYASEIRAGEDSHSYTSRRSQSSSDQEQPLYSPLELSQALSASIAEFQSSDTSSIGDLPALFADADISTGETTRSVVSNTEDANTGDSSRSHIVTGESTPVAPSSPQSDSDMDDPMAQSVMYSQEMGESMYLSAISQDHPESPDYRRAPGYFPDEYETEALSQSTPTVRSMERGSMDELEDRAPTPKGPERSNAALGVNTPSMDHSDSSLPQSRIDQARKRLISLDTMTIWLPSSIESTDENDAISQSAVFDASPQNSISASTFARNIPGTFSAYAEMGSSRRLQSSYIQEQSSVSDIGPRPTASAGALDIDLGILDIQADLSTVRLIYDMTKLVMPGSTGTSRAPKKVVQPDGQSAFPHLSLRLRTLRIAFLESLAESSEGSTSAYLSVDTEQSKVLIRANARDITFGLTPQLNAPDITFAIRRFSAGTETRDILSFKRPPSYHQHRNDSPDVLVKVQRSKVTLQNNPITDIRAWLCPININFDLLAIDEALGSFGGLSGVMELSASAMSSDSDQVNAVPPPTRRGVRFEEDAKPETVSTNSPELKINISIQGASVALRSHSCSPELQCSAIKISVRPNYIIATVGKAQLYEENVSSQSSASRFTVNLKDIKLEYLTAPEDTDLERLLSLITPSKNKYENDDDILLDTLIRQRRKGSVLRIKVVSAQAEVRCWTLINDLQNLGEELSKFSAVTKYLPEDDRPGLLILPRIADFNARLPVNDDFGVLEVSCRDIQLAQIGLPVLVALSIGGIRAGPLGGLDIIREIRPAEQLPMVMMRMVGDEVEPTVKIKIFNLCVEYNVPTFVALTGLNVPVNPEKAIQDIAMSIMNVATLEGEEALSSPAGQSEALTRASKKIGLDVLLHDCAIGLKPRELSAKGMLVLANTKLSAVVPPDDEFSATLELRKASLYIIDQEVSNPRASEVAFRLSPETDRLSSHLTAQGFVSVSSIMSAKAIVNIIENKDEKTRSIDIEIRDELFVLETCADSMQTLIGILNGLAPPSPPTDQPEFRTEVMTMEDMITSFTGDAFERPPSGPSTLFDADETSPLPEVDELLQESAMTSSLYGPIDASFDMEEDHAIYEGDQINTQTVESFIEEEGFFEIMDTPTAQRLSNDALWETVQKQSLKHAGGKPSELKLFHYDDQYIDKAQNMVLDAPYRFNAPATPFPGSNTIPQKRSFPLQVRVRDVHIIWNLFDGYDWEQTRKAIAEAVEEVELKLEDRKQRRRRSTEPEEEEGSVIGDCLFNSIYIGVPANRDAADLRREISRGIDDLASESESYATSGTSRPTQYSATRQSRPPRRKKLRLTRSKAHKIAFELKGVSLDFSVHPPSSGEVQSSVDVRLRDFEIFDNVPTSTWRKFLTYHHDEEKMREMMKPMIHLELLNVRPVPDLAATELSLRVSVLPLRLHVDQDALDFITRFFEFKSDSVSPAPPSDPPFIQRIEVNTVNLCLDYKPKKVDYGGIRSGHTGEFKNFVILDRANIKLKHVIVYGVKGFDALHPTLSDIWTPDVIRTQLPGVLAGLAPLRSIVSLGVGVRDVVAIPIREYKKDGRLVRSVQKGAFHFAKTTTAELARLGAKIAVGTQNVLSGVEETLGRVHQRPDDGLEYEERRLVSNYADQPLGVLQGLRSARRQLECDLLTARDAFIAIQGEVVDASSAAGAAQAFARHAPTIVLRPVIGASRAVGQTLMGVGNQVDNANVRRNEDKYKPR